MIRRVTLAVAVALGTAVLVAALLWIARLTARLEAGEAEARRLAAQEERVRLALWRMDSALATFLALENARPVDPPAGAPPADAAWVAERFEVAATVTPDPELPPTAPVAPRLPSASPPEPKAAATPSAAATAAADPPAQERELQQHLNVVEFEQRQKFAGQQSAFVPGVAETPAEIPRPDEAAASPSGALSPEPEPRTRRGPAVASPRGPTGVLRALEPRWEEPGRLVLVRRVVRDGAEAEQGIVLDEELLAEWLLAEIGDLVPGSELEPAPVVGPADPGRRLALLPLRLVPGPAPAPAAAGLSPARVGLWTAIGAILVVAVAAALTLVSRLRLARRRTEFASAVIHELRTPLTTFRVTTELLADDMVPPAERPEHLGTLRGEAERLGRLVDNVLAFARLERRARPRTERLALAPWLEDTAGRLGRQAAEHGLELRLAGLEAIAGVEVAADPTALERILDNLCDNSCKYARGSTPPRIDVGAELRGRHAVVRWRDHGPGLGEPGSGRATRHRLFRPYRRGGAESSAVPGVGLGLALARGLARGMGGDLRWVEPEDLAEGRGGAAFELRLPRLSRPD